MAVVVFASTTDPPLPLKSAPAPVSTGTRMHHGRQADEHHHEQRRARRMGSARSHDVMSIPMPTISEGIAQSCRE